MFKIFKRGLKSHRRGHEVGNVNNNVTDATSSLSGHEDCSNDSSKRHSLRSTSSFWEEVYAEELVSMEDDVHSFNGAVSLSGTSVASVCRDTEGRYHDIFNYQSRLSVSICSMASDPECLSYFVQYLDTKNALPLIKFYLDIENFRLSAIAEVESENCGTSIEGTENLGSAEIIYNHHDEESEMLTDTHDHDDNPDHEHKYERESASAEKVEKANSVPELKALCDISMHKSLTDDEKSQIYAVSNKHSQSNGNSNQLMKSNLSLDSENVVLSAVNEECDETDGGNIGRISEICIKDAIAIYQKYLTLDAKNFVSLPVEILSEISLQLCKCRDTSYNANENDYGDDDHDHEHSTKFTQYNHTVSINCFDEAQKYVLTQLEEHYLNDFLQSSFYCKYCLELIECGENGLSILDILHSEATLFFFMEFLEQHSERDCLDFWTTAVNFRKSYVGNSAGQIANRNESEIQADAMIIYEKFFSLQSNCRLWMSQKLRSIVEERICAVGHVAYCFDVPLKVVAKYLEQKYLADFLKSQLFKDYVNELRTKLNESCQHKQADGNKSSITDPATQSYFSLRRNKCQPMASGHRKTFSDCTNDNSRTILKHISQHNTLLAGDSNSHLKQLHTSGTNMNIDARHLTNPDLLWQRAGSPEGGLKFGRINALGRYERDFDVADHLCGSVGGKHNWSLIMGGNRLKNAVRKLVHLPEMSAQEEIAWQVAEMIVKDVTDITLHNCDSP